MIIGVTLFLENVEIIKHKLEIASITPHDIKYARKNLHNISPSERNNNPLWKPISIEEITHEQIKSLFEIHTDKLNL